MTLRESSKERGRLGFRAYFEIGFLKIRYKYHSDGNNKTAPAASALTRACNTLSGAAEFANVRSGSIKNGNCANAQPAMMNEICAIASKRARRYRRLQTAANADTEISPVTI